MEKISCKTCYFFITEHDANGELFAYEGCIQSEGVSIDSHHFYGRVNPGVCDLNKNYNCPKYKEDLGLDELVTKWKKCTKQFNIGDL